MWYNLPVKIRTLGLSHLLVKTIPFFQFLDDSRWTIDPVLSL